MDTKSFLMTFYLETAQAAKVSSAWGEIIQAQANYGVTCFLAALWFFWTCMASYDHVTERVCVCLCSTWKHYYMVEELTVQCNKVLWGQLFMPYLIWTFFSPTSKRKKMEYSHTWNVIMNSTELFRNLVKLLMIWYLFLIWQKTFMRTFFDNWRKLSNFNHIAFFLKVPFPKVKFLSSNYIWLAKLV